METKIKLSKYKKNLSIVEIDKVFYVESYQTIVARISNESVTQLGYWSQTTQKHINFVSYALGLKLIKP
jgi:hypothetical protein